jgi:transposase
MGLRPNRHWQRPTCCNRARGGAIVWRSTGLNTTVYNRFNRWSRQGVWHGIFKALAGHSGIYSSTAIDSTSGRKPI